mmetsp:Transcript_663/g.2213  ORF Transcript_663/g.2213 Transcript_663/m.2213 type:complete len:276 (-) Transcript_663:603-1430(-)
MSPLFFGLLFLEVAVLATAGEDGVKHVPYTGTDVIELDPYTFETMVEHGKGIWMIEFYAPWCDYCNVLAPEYIKAASLTKGAISFGAMNVDKYKDAQDDQGIFNLPTLRMYGESKDNFISYMGKQLAEDMADATLNLLDKSNYVFNLNRDSIHMFVRANNHLPMILLFTDETATDPSFKALALEFKGRLALGEAQSKVDKAASEHWKVPRELFPVIKMVPPRDEGPLHRHGPLMYEGKLDSPELRKWLEAIADGRVPGTSYFGAAKAADGGKEEL